MLRSISRALLCRQIYAHRIHVGVTGASGTPVAAGMDTSFIDSITDNGTGDYTINLKDKAQRDVLIAGIHCSTDGLYARVSAVTENSIRVLLKTFAGVATDGDVTIDAIWHGSKHLY